MEYPIVIAPLPEEDGGGFVGMAPDLVGCISDGETPEEAFANTLQAISEWLDTAKNRGMDIPAPGSEASRRKTEREQLVEKLRAVTSGVDQIESRLLDLEVMIKEIDEKLEHASEWERFAILAGFPDDRRLPHKPGGMPC